LLQSAPEWLEIAVVGETDANALRHERHRFRHCWRRRVLHLRPPHEHGIEFNTV
jgi:hypothetical protein